MPTPIALEQQKYVSLTTFRKSGVAVRTPVWFAEAGGKLYLFTNPNSGKVKRIRNNPRVLVAPCTFRGKIKGPDFAGIATVIPAADSDFARHLMREKYWLMRIPFLWRKSSIFLQVELT